MSPLHTTYDAYLGEAQLQLTGLGSGSGYLGAHGLACGLGLHWLDCWLCCAAQQCAHGDGASLASGGAEQSGCHLCLFELKLVVAVGELCVFKSV
jgi:hypothetical protein